MVAVAAAAVAEEDAAGMTGIPLNQAQGGQVVITRMARVVTSGVCVVDPSTLASG